MRRLILLKTLRFILKYFFLFYIGGLTYCGIEMLYRGRTHWSMFLCAGIIFIYASVQNEVFEWDYPFWKQLLKVWIFALIAEFITGCIVNLWLGWNVWDYSNLRFNLLGQTSLTFALLFLPICAFAIIFDDYIRYLFFDEEPPRYKFL